MDNEQESPPSSPALEGYDTAGEEINVSSGSETTVPSPVRRRKTPKKPTKRLPQRYNQRDSKGRFIKALACCSKPRRETGTGSEGGLDADSESVDSLQWDAHTEDLDVNQVERQRPPIALSDVLVSESDQSSSGQEEGGRVSVLGRQYRMADVDRTRDAVERALMEIEDDILPFAGKNMTTERLDALAAKAATLKRALQDGHLYLAANDTEEYEANLREQVTVNRRALSVFIVGLEELKASKQDAAVAAARADDGTATAEAGRRHARQEVVRRRVDVLHNQVKTLLIDGQVFCKAKASSDEELYERAEKHKLLVGRLLTVLEECKLLANQALENDLIEESTNLDGAVSSLRALQLEAENAMLSSRKVAGVWSEKGRRTAARGDLKMPVFAGTTSDKLTVYEFEKEWAAYRAAVNYSVEEALKELKMAVQPPTRAAVQKMTTEKLLFDYLKAHFGNPVILLSAREAEIRAWADCKGNDTARREWLISAKDRLEATTTLCEEHNISKYMHFSSIAGLVQSKMPEDMVRDFKKVLVKHLSPAGVLEKEIIIGLLITFIEAKIQDCTLGVNLDIVSFLGASGAETQKKVPEQQQSNGNGKQGSWSKPKYGQHSQQINSNSGGNGASNGGGRGGQAIDPTKCVTCGNNHHTLFYCEAYIKSRVADRFELVKAQKACGRCLTMKRKFPGKKSEWWPPHERYCRNSFVCAEGSCGNKQKDKQLHMTLCGAHVAENKAREADFVKSLDPKSLPSGASVSSIWFLHMHAQMLASSGTPAGGSSALITDEDGYELIPDVYETGLFLLQLLPSEHNPAENLLCFYDSGCASAGLSDNAYGQLRTTTTRNGPTVLEVAGGKSILVPHGEEQFYLELATSKQKAAITGLRMPNITAEFPLVQLVEAWEELAGAATMAGQPLKDLSIDLEIGGRCVDVILGIRYSKYYPELVFTLPSGLAVYRGKLKSASGHQAVLGGPHAAWSGAVASTRHMNPRVYFTMEARAWYVEQKWVQINGTKLSKKVEMEVDIEEKDVVSCLMHSEELVDGGCDHCHCNENDTEQLAVYNVAGLERKLWEVEQLGTESPYRCISCRSCSKCRKGDELEMVSLKEEAEQALIENSVELDADSNILWATLPFVDDPVKSLFPNRFIAEKVLQSQQRSFSRDPGMRVDAVKSHQKLLDRGYVIAATELPAEIKRIVESTPGPGYFIPWRTVYNEGSVSTPCRLVFDASSKTPGGNSLNGVLAKGQNRLVKLQHLLIKFRHGQAAVTADISMAYNGTRLKPEHLAYQKYLWQDQLDPAAPVKVMHVTTLIYGVKPSGQQCQAALERLADHYLEAGTHQLGACALKETTYVDDILNSQKTVGHCEAVALDIETILKKGSMSVKAFSFSGRPPSEKVSADGVHVGLAGYLWATEPDLIKLDVGPVRLGKAKRGKRPNPVAGDLRAALGQTFTKRTLTGLVAGVFDPLGLATPITAGLKLDLHELCTLRLDWDDPVPVELLDKWVTNVEKIQELASLQFQRAIIPVDAVNLDIELLVATDASQNIGVVAVYARILRKTGVFSCQLVAGRSKLLTGLTIPKAEMKSAVTAAVLANVVKTNLGERCNGAIYVTDSTICLFWITQDDRPLQLGVRNAVLEIRRFSDPADWFHIDTNMNVADLGTRSANVEQLAQGSEWQTGQAWMCLPRDQLPIRTAAQVTLTSEEKRVAATELRANDIRGHLINFNSPAVSAHYQFSKYLVDPCRHTWSSVVRIMALVLKFVAACRAARGPGKLDQGQQVDSNQEEAEDRSVRLNPVELAAGEEYFYRKATAEVKQFNKPADYKQFSKEKNGILYFTGRLLGAGGVKGLEEVMFDLSPVSFCRPLADRHSPVAYAVMLETHWQTVHHLNATTTYRESLSVVFTLRGRDLALEIREGCSFCKRYKANLVDVEMGKIHEARLTIAPPFTLCQVDLFGPLEARCEHNHRAVVKVWGAVFKDPASGAVFVHAMAKCDTSAFVQAYTRFAARFCHPKRLYPDEGSQLLKACAEMQISWVDVSYTLNSQFQVGVEFKPCPVGGHNYHGQVERSIREIKKLFTSVYRGVKLDILGYETAFAWVSNELNNLPICLGSRYKNLDNLDLITPNRLIQGRSNRRAMSGPCTIEAPSRMLEKMDDIFEAWWKVWSEERLADFVAKPPKWFRSDPDLELGNIVVFQKRGPEQAIGSPVWTIGRIVNVTKSAADGRVREVEVEYKNASEKTWRVTHRAARAVAVLHREEDLEVLQGLNAAARDADRLHVSWQLYVDQQEAVVKEMERCQPCKKPVLCCRHSAYFEARPYIFPDEDQEPLVQ